MCVAVHKQVRPGVESVGLRALTPAMKTLANNTGAAASLLSKAEWTMY